MDGGSTASYQDGVQTKDQMKILQKLNHQPKLIEFPEQTVVIAKDQPEYNPLPAHQFKDETGRIACCWQLSIADRIRLLLTGKIWHQILTFNMPLQPQLITVEKPEMNNGTKS